MVHQTAITATIAALFATQSFASALPAMPAKELVARDTIDSNSVSCFNTWETVTNDPVVQYWYMVVPDSGVKADRMWNHLNLNDCAPTENKYYNTPKNGGIALTFHASEACTAKAVSEAYRSSSDPPKNVGCTFTGKDGVDGGEAGATAIDGAFNALLEGLGAL